MKDTGTVNSTELLLNTIRMKGRNDPGKGVSHSSDVLPGTAAVKSTRRKKPAIGIMLQKRTASFVMTAPGSHGWRKGLVKWSVFPLPDDTGSNSENFTAFMAEHLHLFAGGRKDIPIWCNIESAALKLRHIIIPDVPPSKIANTALWGLKKEVEFDQADEIFDYKVISDIQVNGLKKKKILAWIADRKKVEAIKKAFFGTGFRLKGITALPFAIQNFTRFGYIDTTNPPVTVVNLSGAHSEIFCFSQEGILFSRVLRTDFFDLLDRAGGPSALTAPDRAAAAGDPDLNDARQSCDRLMGKIARTGDYCSQHYCNNTPVSRYVFIGDLFEPNNGFLDFLNEKLPVPVEEFIPAVNSLPGTDETALPEAADKKNDIILAYAIALSSDGHTPNFIFTSQDREKKKRERKINLGLLGFFIFTLLACAGVLAWQNTLIGQNQAQLNALIQKRHAKSPDISLDVTQKLIKSAKTRISLEEKYHTKYLPLAMINIICALTPETIRLGSLETYFQGSEKFKLTQNVQGNTPHAKITLSGKIPQAETNPEAELTRYIFQLNDSGLFGNIGITRKKLVKIDKTSTLRFTLSMDVLK